MLLLVTLTCSNLYLMYEKKKTKKQKHLDAFISLFYTRREIQKEHDVTVHLVGI